MATNKLQIIGSVIATDETLTQAGVPADAKATGDAIRGIQLGLFDVDYDSMLAFDTSEIVFLPATTSILDQAIIGQLVLA